MGVEASKTVNFQIVGGSFFVPETMEALAESLRGEGRTAEVVYDMPTQEKNATIEDHAQVLANQLRGLENVVLITYSGGRRAADPAMEILAEEKEGGNPVVLDIPISGTLGPHPAAASGAAIPRPRNSQKFRDGLEYEHEPDGSVRVGFNPAKALEVLFNRSRHIGHVAVPGMVSQYMVEAPPMPEKLHAPMLYLFPRHDLVRDLESVLETAACYTEGPNKMKVYVTEGDHGVALAGTDYLARLIIDACISRGIIQPVAEKPPAALPGQRQAMDNLSTPTAAYSMV